MLSNNSPEAQLRAENADLRARLQEAEETLHAIRSGAVDSLVVKTAGDPQIFTLASADATSNRLRGRPLPGEDSAEMTSEYVAGGDPV